MKKSIYFKGILVSCVLLCLFGLLLSGCGSGSVAAETEAAVSDEGTAAYHRIMEEEHIDIDAAYDELSKMELSDGEAAAFLQKLDNLRKCEGHFIHESEASGNLYTADVTFYLQKGETFFSMPYTGYKGKIADGVVRESSDSDYLYESETTGEHNGQEQEFIIHFAESIIHVEWGGSSDYVLKRDDGMENDDEGGKQTSEKQTPFEETGTYKAVEELIDNIYDTTEHKLYYDTDSRELNLYLQAPDSTRAFMTSGNNNEKVQSSWDNVASSLTEVGGQLYTILHAGKYGDHVNIYMVDELKPDNGYSSEDYLLWIDNEEIRYDFSKDEAFPAEAEAGDVSDDGQNSALSFDGLRDYIVENGTSDVIDDYSGACLDITSNNDKNNTCRLMADSNDKTHIIVQYSIPYKSEEIDDTIELTLSLYKNNDTADYRLRVPVLVNLGGKSSNYDTFDEGRLSCKEYQYHDEVVNQYVTQIMPALVHTLEVYLENLDSSFSIEDLGFLSLKEGPPFV